LVVGTPRDEVALTIDDIVKVGAAVSHPGLAAIADLIIASVGCIASVSTSDDKQAADDQHRSLAACGDIHDAADRTLARCERRDVIECHVCARTVREVRGDRALRAHLPPVA
jgi:hypothetical protein